jgi:hypothetical protein
LARSTRGSVTAPARSRPTDAPHHGPAPSRVPALASHA